MKTHYSGLDMTKKRSGCSLAARLRGFSPPCYLRSATLPPFLSTSSLKKPRLRDALRTATLERQAEHGGPAVRRGDDEGDGSATRGLAMAEGGKRGVQRRAAWRRRDTHTRPERGEGKGNGATGDLARPGLGPPTRPVPG